MPGQVSSTSLKWYLLTTVISVLHSFFAYMAFKNDIGFWKARRPWAHRHTVTDRVAIVGPGAACCRRRRIPVLTHADAYLQSLPVATPPPQLSAVPGAKN